MSLSGEATETVSIPLFERVEPRPAATHYVPVGTAIELRRADEKRWTPCTAVKDRPFSYLEIVDLGGETVTIQTGAVQVRFAASAVQVLGENE